MKLFFVPAGTRVLVKKKSEDIEKIRLHITKHDNYFTREELITHTVDACQYIFERDGWQVAVMTKDIQVM